MTRKLIIVLLLSLPCFGQNWSGILSTSRAVNWSNAGVIGGIPTTRTQCGSTIAAYTGSTAAINSALAACGANQYVLLGPGTFNLSSGGINFDGVSSVTLRGSGPDQTFLVMGSGSGLGCSNGGNATVCINGSFNWSGGPQNLRLGREAIPLGPLQSHWATRLDYQSEIFSSSTKPTIRQTQIKSLSAIMETLQ